MKRCFSQWCCTRKTTSPTTLLGCWAKFRTGLPPYYRSGLVDGKCVWRLSRRVSLTPLCIACLDLTSTTSGKRDHVTPEGAVTGLPTSTTTSDTPPPRIFFFTSFDQFLLVYFQPIIRKTWIKWNWGEVTEVEPGANDTWRHQSQVQPCKCQPASEKNPPRNSYKTPVIRLKMRLIIKITSTRTRKIISKNYDGCKIN